VAADERQARGRALLDEINPISAEHLFAELEEVAPDMVGLVTGFAYGEVYQRPGLDLRSRAIATLAGLTALGHAQRELKSHVRNALNVGLSASEIVEILMHMSVYAGFPAAINAILTAREIFAEQGLLPLEEK
jgi:4-carboxymuconolactone decarboxylase